MQVVDKTTGKPIEIPDEQLQAAFQSGLVSLPATARIPIQRGTGEIGTVSAQYLDDELDKGASVMSQKDYDKAALEAKYGGSVDSAIATAEGGARGLAMAGGIPLDAVAIGAAGKLGGPKAKQAVREHLSNEKEAHPYLSGGAELGGALLPLAVGDPEGVAGEAAERGLARVGEEGLAERAPLALGAGERAPLELGAGERGLAVRGPPQLPPASSYAEGNVGRAPYVTDGELLGGGGPANDNYVNISEAAEPAAQKPGAVADNFFNEVAKGDEARSTAKQIADAVTLPARQVSEAGNMIERSVGAIVGDNSPNVMARAVQKGLAKGASNAFEGAIFNTANQVNEDALGDQDTTAQKLAAAAGHGAVFGLALGGAMGVGGAGAEAGLGKLARSPLAQRIAESEAWRSISPRKYFSKEAERIQGGWRGVGRELLDSGLIRAGDDVERIAPRIEQARAESGQKLGAMYSELENRGASAIDINPLIKQIRKDLPEAAQMLKNTAGTMGKVDQIIQDLTELAGPEGKISLGKLQSLRVNFDTLINWAKAEPGPQLQALRSARRTIEEHLISAADSEAKRLGMSETWKIDYLREKRRFQRLAVADDAASDSVERMHSNNVTSPTDRLAGATVGLGGMLAAAHPAGLAGMAMHAIGGLAAAQVSKQIRTRGNATIAAFLDKAKDLAAIKQVTSRLDARVAHETGKALAGKVLKAQMVNVDDYDDVANRVRGAKMDHDAAVSAHLGSIKNNAPGISGKFSNVMRQATAFLISKMPPEKPAGLFGPKPEVSYADKIQFLTAERAVSHPDVLLQDIQSGTLTQDTVDAVQAVYPAYLDEVRSQVLHQLESGEDIPYDRRLQVATLLGIDPDGTLDPTVIQGLQASYTHTDKPKKQGTPKKANVKNVGKGMTLSSRSLSSSM